MQDARQAALIALGTELWAIPADLGEMPEEAWETALAGARAAKTAREAKAREEEAARVAAEQERR